MLRPMRPFLAVTKHCFHMSNSYWQCSDPRTFKRI